MSLSDADKKKLEEGAKKKIKKAFDIFDRENNGTCDEREVGTIMRALNLNPSQAEYAKVLQDIKEEEPTGYVRYERLEPVLVKLLTSGDFVRDSEEVIMKAFKLLDKENKGYLEPDELRDILLQNGEKFSSDEMEEMLNAAVDPETGQIQYEDYASILALD